MKPFFTILSDPHFGQLNFPSLIQLSLHTLYTYPYIFGTTDCFRRGEQGLWVLQSYRPDGTSFRFDSIGFEETIVGLYEDVTLG